MGGRYGGTPLGHGPREERHQATQPLEDGTKSRILRAWCGVRRVSPSTISFIQLP